jgi:hypothetical protein
MMVLRSPFAGNLQVNQLKAVRFSGKAVNRHGNQPELDLYRAGAYILVPDEETIRCQSLGIDPGDRTARPSLNNATEQHLRINRRHRRVETDIPCEVGLPGERPGQARLLNLSLGGMKFQCGLQLINAIIPEEQRTPGTILDVVLDFHFEIGTDSRKASPVRGKARLVHYERLAQDRFHVGIEFLDLEHELQGRLDEYIDAWDT